MADASQKTIPSIPNHAPIYYSGAFIDQAEHARLLKIFPPKFSNTFAHHLTIKYNLTSDECSSVAVGEKVTLTVIGIAEDEKAQALIVKTNLSENKNPHITLSTDNQTRPVYSNELIEKKGYRTLSQPVEINATIGISDGKKVITTRAKITPVTKIILPTRVQIDTAIAIFILQTFGVGQFPGILSAEIECRQTLPDGETYESLLHKGVLTIDVGAGPFDHHTKEGVTVSDLVSEHMGIKNNPSLNKLLSFARRDDLEGKGTISTDNLDRAFGLSGLITALNKMFPQNPSKILQTILPLLSAHYTEEIKRTEEMPAEIKEMLANGKAERFIVVHRGRKLEVIMTQSDNTSLPGYLRSHKGGEYDVIVQELSSGHFNILTRPVKNIDLRSLVALIRTEEACVREISTLTQDVSVLAGAGRLEELPMWYFDTTTNSLQNGGVNPKGAEPSKISHTVLRKILEAGLSESLWKPNN